jgi:predicted transcriptional regulator
MQHRALSTISRSVSALSVFEKSCYRKVEFRISEENSVKDAVVRFTAFNVGCLAVTDKNNKVVGVCSERDYINKVAALDKNPSEVRVKDICTYGPKIITADKTDSLDECMNKMMFKDIRHLLILDDKNPDFTGMISIRDLIREILKDKSDAITRLSDFKVGKGGFFGSE